MLESINNAICINCNSELSGTKGKKGNVLISYITEACQIFKTEYF